MSAPLFQITPVRNAADLEATAKLFRAYASSLNATVAEATRIGYREIRLDTLPTMDSVTALYRGEGFELIPAYYDTPVEGTIFMARTLTNNLANPPSASSRK